MKKKKECSELHCVYICVRVLPCQFLNSPPLVAVLFFKCPNYPFSFFFFHSFSLSMLCRQFFSDFMLSYVMSSHFHLLNNKKIMINNF